MKLLQRVNGLHIVEITKRDTQTRSDCHNLQAGSFAAYDKKNDIIEWEEDNLDCCIEWAMSYERVGDR